MADALKSALDRMELNELMNRYAASIDLRDWTRLRSVFVDGEIEADFTSMGVKQVFRGPAEVEGDRAVDTRYMQAATSSVTPTTPSAATTPGRCCARRPTGAWA